MLANLDTANDKTLACLLPRVATQGEVHQKLELECYSVSISSHHVVSCFVLNKERVWLRGSRRRDKSQRQPRTVFKLAGEQSKPVRVSVKIHFYHPALIQTLSGHWPSDLSWELHVNAAAGGGRSTGGNETREKFFFACLCTSSNFHSNSLDRFWPPSWDTWTLTAASNFKMSGNARQKHVCGRTQTKNLQTRTRIFTQTCTHTNTSTQSRKMIQRTDSLSDRSSSCVLSVSAAAAGLLLL